MLYEDYIFLGKNLRFLSIFLGLALLIISMLQVVYGQASCGVGVDAP